MTVEKVSCFIILASKWKEVILFGLWNKYKIISYWAMKIDHWIKDGPKKNEIFFMNIYKMMSLHFQKTKYCFRDINLVSKLLNYLKNHWILFKNILYLFLLLCKYTFILFTLKCQLSKHGFHLISLECVSGRKWLIILEDDLTSISWLCSLVFMSVSVSNYICINILKTLMLSVSLKLQGKCWELLS